MADDPLQRTYDLVAGEYVAHIFDELKDKPFRCNAIQAARALIVGYLAALE